MDSFAAKGLTGAVGLALALTASGIAAQEVNLYSSRHYDTDVALYDAFTEQTGIAVNLIEGDADQLIERIKAEGRNSPADVLITVDAGRLWRADEAGLLQPVSSRALEEAIPGGAAPSGGQVVRAEPACAGSCTPRTGSTRARSRATRTSPTPSGRAASASARPPTYTTNPWSPP
jgi:hypothetical protein